MTKGRTEGSLDLEYALGRENKKALRYRLWRRTREVLEGMERHAPLPVNDILDLGAAEGRMLHSIKLKYPNARCVGVEYAQELVSFGSQLFPGLELVQGQIQAIPFEDESFDVAVATAVIEHVSDPSKAMAEIRRVLRPGGILVLTAPDPFWDRVATMVGHLPDDQHYNVMNLMQLSDLAVRSGFDVLETEKFMLSPVGMPWEFGVEKWVRRFKMHFFFANQLMIARA